MRLTVGMALVTIAVGAMSVRVQQPPPRLFSDEEVRNVMSYWAEPGRYRVEAPPGVIKTGPLQVRLSPAASQWLWNYNKARGIGKTPPTETPPPLTPDEKEWEKWIDAKVAHDRWEAAKRCSELNSAITGKRVVFDEIQNPEPAHPGPIPASLFALAGDPPPFATTVVPLSHVVRFDEKTRMTNQDNTPMRPRYAYYRFPQGVMHSGKRIRERPKKELDSLFGDADVTKSEQKVLAAVSMLEGGFESVNTYDTGFVSVGFIQFACLKDGAGSLGQVLRRYKNSSPKEFQKDFRAFGLDVTEEGSLVAIDPATGAELKGADAAKKIIDDKRLIAVFQRAGERSRDFRVAQIAVAKALYYPGSDEVKITVGGRELTGKVSDFVNSEAALATLLDRKVNTGKLEPLADVLSYCAEQCAAKSLKDLSKYERDIAAMLKYRKDYLADDSLTQPGPSLLAKRDYEEILSRRGARSGRKPPK